MRQSNDGNNTITGSTTEEINKRSDFFELYKNCPIPEHERLNNLGMYIKRQDMSRILMMDFLYKKIIQTHGIICEFGVRWGHNLALFSTFRGIYEPYNYNRKIVGFDTFKGFTNLHKNDGGHSIIKDGSLSVTDNYQDYLSEVLTFHESQSPISHIKKHELVVGDATVTLPVYLKNNPETIIAFAFFDFDIYTPTKSCLENILPHLTKGSVVAFDQLNFHEFPGETLAVKEVFGLGRYKINRSELAPTISYVVID